MYKEGVKGTKRTCSGLGDTQVQRAHYTKEELQVIQYEEHKIFFLP